MVDSGTLVEEAAMVEKRLVTNWCDGVGLVLYKMSIHVSIES